MRTYRMMLCFLGLLASGSLFAQTGAQILFDLPLAKETQRGTLVGIAGIFRIDYDESNPFELYDAENGMVRKIAIDKIDRLEVAAAEKEGDARHVITLTVGAKTITGEFRQAELLLVTDIEKIDLLTIKKGKVILTRVK